MAKHGEERLWQSKEKKSYGRARGRAAREMNSDAAALNCIVKRRDATVKYRRE